MSWITSLKNRWHKQDAWIIGSGKSMDFVSPEFFAGRLTICLNHASWKFPCAIAIQINAPVLKHPDSAIVVLPVFEKGIWRAGPLRYSGKCVRFTHRNNSGFIDEESLKAIGTDQLVVSGSTIHTATHLAAYMGCSNIILCGHDGGQIDGQWQYEGYSSAPVDRRAIASLMKQTRLLRQALTDHYGCRIYSLTPFAGLTMDGHLFEGAEAVEHSITELKGRWAGEDIWIIGSGKSMDFIAPEFFNGRTTICINRMSGRFPCTIAIQTDNPLLEHPPSAILVAPVYSSGIVSHGPFVCEERDCYRFEHDDNREVIDDEALRVIGSEQRLVMGNSTMHAAMHLAAYAGAKAIFLCGHDGGTLSGHLQVAGYRPADDPHNTWDAMLVNRMMRYTRLLREALTDHYGCRILSLSPFAGLTADGYQFAEC